MASTSTSSWNPRITCTPLVVRIADITANQTQQASFSASPFSPGITTTVLNGEAKRWLTPGPTPPGWVAPGPPCTVTNSKGTTSLFVEIDGIGRSSLTNEDWSTLYDTTNGGTVHASLNTSDTTFNLFDPGLVHNYSNSCISATDPTCYGRIHAEIDHDWKAAGYCGASTFCDNTTLAFQTSPNSTLIDVQGFVYWDPGNLDQTWHQFSGWEIHPLTAWKLSSSPPPPPPLVPDFSISASSSSLSFDSGSTASSTVGVSSLNSFTGTVTLAVSTAPSTGLAITCSPTVLVLSSGGSSSSSCNFSSATPGTYTITVTGTGGDISHSTVITVTVTLEKHDFAITATPALLSLYSGVPGTSNINIIAGTVFFRTVSLTVGATPGLTATISPTSIDSSGSALLTVSAGAIGNYTAIVTGSTRNGIIHSVTVTVRVVDFAVTVSPADLTANAGVPAVMTVTIVPINGFNGTVLLVASPSAGLSASLNPIQVTGGGTSTLTVSSALTGNYTVTVTGTSGPLSHTSSTVSVKVVDFALSASPTALGPLYAGSTDTVTITVSGVNGFSGLVSLTASPSAGLDAVINPSSITGSGTATLTVSATTAGDYTVTVTGTSDSLTHQTTTITVTVVDFSISTPSSVTLNVGDSGTATVTLTSLNQFAGNVSVSSSVSPNASLVVTCAPSVLTLSSGGSATSSCLINSSTTGSYTVTVTGAVGPLVHTATITVNVVDFNIATNPATLTLNAGSQGASTITITPINGFAGPVTLSAISSPGLSVSLSPSALSGSGSSTLTLSSSVAGDYFVNITATSDSLSHSVLVTVHVVDFTLSAAPNNLAFNAGQSGTATLTITGLNGFSGTVTLSTVASPGLTASLGSSTLTGSGTVNLTLTAATAGNYTVTVTATSGSLTHTIVLTVRVGTFSMSVSPSSLSIVQGSTSSFTATFTSINGFAGTIDLSSTVSRSSGLAVSCTSSSVVLSPGGTVTVTCTVSGLSNGNYTITLTATNGSISQSSSVSVRVRQH